jgi:hypothetical protein
VWRKQNWKAFFGFEFGIWAACATAPLSQLQVILRSSGAAVVVYPPPSSSLPIRPPPPPTPSVRVQPATRLTQRMRQWVMAFGSQAALGCPRRFNRPSHAFLFPRLHRRVRWQLRVRLRRSRRRLPRHPLRRARWLLRLLHIRHPEQHSSRHAATRLQCHRRRSLRFPGRNRRHFLLTLPRPQMRVVQHRRAEPRGAPRVLGTARSPRPRRCSRSRSRRCCRRTRSRAAPHPALLPLSNPPSQLRQRHPVRPPCRTRAPPRLRCYLIRNTSFATVCQCCSRFLPPVEASPKLHVPQRRLCP